MTDLLFKWVDYKKKQEHLNGWQKEKLLWSRETPEKEPSLATIDRQFVKILIAQFREIYYSFVCRGRFPEERKKRYRRIRGTGDLQYIDQYILKESKARRKGGVMAWIDYKNVYDIVPQGWITEYLKTHKIFWLVFTSS